MTNRTSLPSIEQIRNPLTKKFLVKIYNQVHRDNRDCIIAVCGGTGSGKSTIALWLAQTLDTNYKGESRFNSARIVFGFHEWTELLKESHPNGTAIIMEEPQAYFNSRMFASKTNIDAIAKFSTGRIFQYIYILTYPSFERIDSQIRERIHFLVDTDGMNRDKKLNFWKPYEIFPNYKPNYPVWKAPLTFTQDSFRMKMRCVSPMPGEDLWDEYYAKSSQWKLLVKEGKISSAGDVKKEESEGDEIRKLVDKRKAQHEKMRVASRIRDTQVIQEKGLDDCKSINEIMKKGVSYVPAHRIMKILKEREEEHVLDQVNYHEQK